MKQYGFGMIVYLIAGIAILAILSGMAWKIRESGKDVIRLEWAEANRLQRDKEAKQAAGAATKLEVKREKARIINRVITERVNVEVEKLVYRDVCFEPMGVCLANAAISGASPDTCKPDPAMPPAPKPKGRDGIVSLALDRGGFGDVSGLR